MKAKAIVNKLLETRDDTDPETYVRNVANQPVTWNRLLQMIRSLSAEQREQDVMVMHQDEFYPVAPLNFVALRELPCLAIPQTESIITVTWKKLSQLIRLMSAAQRNQNVNVLDSSELYPIEPRVFVTGESDPAGGILDDGTPYLATAA